MLTVVEDAAFFNLKPVYLSFYSHKYNLNIGTVLAAAQLFNFLVRFSFFFFFVSKTSFSQTTGCFILEYYNERFSL